MLLGSPPPMRGKARLATRKASPTGITPAYAGKRKRMFQLLNVPKDHPRLCGEKYQGCAGNGRMAGSPPPMRGKVKGGEAVTQICGITPAYAGKRGSCRSAFLRCTDHPRLCGEKWRWRLKRTRRIGSPPPMRGKVSTFFCLLMMTRITPAYAGKSSGGFRISFRLGDHPRLCGEKLCFSQTLLCHLGSPPPMRGKDITATWATSIFRITPAYAGKSSVVPYPVPASRDHPRLCGEKVQTASGIAPMTGSPPPMRGKATRTPLFFQNLRITPAYAGKSYNMFSSPYRK